LEDFFLKNRKKGFNLLISVVVVAVVVDDVDVDVAEKAE
jgi:hypothetical protein